MPGTELGSGDRSMDRCSFCFHGAYSLKVETDMQTNVQYSKVLPWRYLQSAVGIWKREKAHLPGGDEGQLHRGGRQRAATGPVLENRPCGQQAEGTTGAETEAQAALRRSR